MALPNNGYAEQWLLYRRTNWMDKKPNQFFSKFFLYAKRLVKATFLAIGLYFSVILIGLIPANNDFQPDPDGIKIYLVSNPFHSDIILPKTSSVIDWSKKFDSEIFGGAFFDESHIAFGWGDRGFFLETETWDDMKFSTAANALLLPSTSCIHVAFTNPAYYLEPGSVSISNQQYQALVKHIEQTFQKNDQGEYVHISGYAYSNNDAFFNANGNYHLLNTCNSWVGRALKSAGVRVPWLSPMPGSPMLYLDDDEIEK